MDNLSHNTSEQNASIEPPDLPEGWRYADSEVWKDPYLAARKRVRALKVALVGLVLACVAGLLVWNASTWLLWSVVRQRRAINGLLPYGFLLGLNVYLSDQGMGNLLGV